MPPPPVAVALGRGRGVFGAPPPPPQPPALPASSASSSPLLTAAAPFDADVASSLDLQPYLASPFHHTRSSAAGSAADSDAGTSVSQTLPPATFAALRGLLSRRTKEEEEAAAVAAAADGGGVFSGSDLASEVLLECGSVWSVHTRHTGLGASQQASLADEEEEVGYGTDDDDGSGEAGDVVVGHGDGDGGDAASDAAASAAAATTLVDVSTLTLDVSAELPADDGLYGGGGGVAAAWPAAAAAAAPQHRFFSDDLSHLLPIETMVGGSVGSGSDAGEDIVAEASEVGDGDEAATVVLQPVAAALAAVLADAGVAVEEVEAEAEALASSPSEHLLPDVDTPSPYGRDAFSDEARCDTAVQLREHASPVFPEEDAAPAPAPTPPVATAASTTGYEAIVASLRCEARERLSLEIRLLVLEEEKGRVELSEACEVSAPSPPAAVAATTTTATPFRQHFSAADATPVSEAVWATSHPRPASLLSHRPSLTPPRPEPRRSPAAAAATTPAATPVAASAAADDDSLLLDSMLSDMSRCVATLEATYGRTCHFEEDPALFEERQQQQRPQPQQQQPQNEERRRVLVLPRAATAVVHPLRHPRGPPTVLPARATPPASAAALGAAPSLHASDAVRRQVEGCHVERVVVKTLYDGGSDGAAPASAAAPHCGGCCHHVHACHHAHAASQPPPPPPQPPVVAAAPAAASEAETGGSSDVAAAAALRDFKQTIAALKRARGTGSSDAGRTQPTQVAVPPQGDTSYEYLGGGAAGDLSGDDLLGAEAEEGVEVEEEHDAAAHAAAATAAAAARRRRQEAPPQPSSSSPSSQKPVARSQAAATGQLPPRVRYAGSASRPGIPPAAPQTLNRSQQHGDVPEETQQQQQQQQQQQEPASASLLSERESHPPLDVTASPSRPHVLLKGSGLGGGAGRYSARLRASRGRSRGRAAATAAAHSSSPPPRSGSGGSGGGAAARRGRSRAADADAAEEEVARLLQPTRSSLAKKRPTTSEVEAEAWPPAGVGAHAAARRRPPFRPSSTSPAARGEERRRRRSTSSGRGGGRASTGPSVTLHAATSSSRAKVRDAATLKPAVPATHITEVEARDTAVFRRHARAALAAQLRLGPGLTA